MYAENAFTQCVILGAQFRIHPRITKCTELAKKGTNRKEHDYLETSHSLLSEASSGWMNTIVMSKDKELLIESYDETEEFP